jgi:uncharacterized protein YdeI (YjbR/CyaY-like superfamily)
MPDKLQTFRATLEQLHDGLGWTIVRVPFVPGKVWKQMIRLRVHGTINGFAFRNSLFPFTSGGSYFLLVNKTMQQGAHAHLGDTAEFTLQPDLDPRPAELPDELAALLDEVEGLRPWYDSLSESMRREIGKWIVIAKSDAARLQRCEHMAERLLGAMEGERELPPVVAAAFRQRPKAKLGWQKMTITQHRQELLAIFYYRTPESRDKRVQKLCDTAENRVANP